MVSSVAGDISARRILVQSDGFAATS